MSGLRAWDRQPGESVQAFHAFSHYRDLPASLRLEARAFTVHELGCRKTKGPDGEALAKDPERIDDPLAPPKNWLKWSRDNAWSVRVDAYEAEQAEQDRQRQADEVTAMNDRHAQIAKGLQAKAIERLNQLQPTDLTPGQLLQYLDTATAIERRAHEGTEDGSKDAKRQAQRERMGKVLEFGDLTMGRRAAR